MSGEKVVESLAAEWSDPGVQTRPEAGAALALGPVDRADVVDDVADGPDAAVEPADGLVDLLADVHEPVLAGVGALAEMPVQGVAMSWVSTTAVRSRPSRETTLVMGSKSMAKGMPLIVPPAGEVRNRPEPICGQPSSAGSLWTSPGGRSWTR